MLGLALPVILLYILKLRLRRVNVSTNLFWKQIYDERPPRSIWQYFRHLVSLLLQLLLLALLVFSVADPYFPWQILQARRVVAVIDNSASMQANDIDPTRFEAAIDSAVTMVEGLRFRDQMAIVLSGPTPEVVLGMTSHTPTLKGALRDLVVSDNPTELEGAIELGKKLIGKHPRGEVVVFTDGCQTNWPKMESSESAAGSADAASSVSTEVSDRLNAGATGEVTVDHRIFGKRSSNVGITQFQVRRSLIDPMGYQVLAAVQNASDDPVKCRLEIELDGAPVDVMPLDLEPNELWSRSIEKTSLEGGTLIGRLTAFHTAAATAETTVSTETRGASDLTDIELPNHLACDDEAQAILPSREIQKVLVVTKGNLFLRKVFEANPLVQVSIAAEFPERWPTDSIVVFDREMPEQLPNNDVFVVDPISSCDLWELGELLRDPIVTEQDKDSPLMKHVRLDNVLMPEAHKITIKGKSRTLAGALSKDPVYAEIRRDSRGKCLVLTVNLEKSDLAFRTAFPILVTNALGWFSGTSGEFREAMSTGETVAFGWESKNNRTLRLTSPDAKSSMIRATGVTSNEGEVEGDTTLETSWSDPEAVTLGPFERSGIWTVHEVEVGDSAEDSAATDPALPPLATFAVNVASQRETDLRPPEELLDQDNSKPLVSGLFSRPPWFYLVAAGFVLSVFEWFLYQRRVIS